MQTQEKRGLFVVFEGPEHGGKTTQAQLLVSALQKKGTNEAVYAREPGGTVIGEKIRGILLDNTSTIHPRTELFLFLTSRTVFVEEIVKPIVRAGMVLVSDRFDLSTFAYQIAARGLSETDSLAANAFAKDHIVPDIYFLLKVSKKTGHERMKKIGKVPDRIEEESAEFHEKVLQGYEYFQTKLPNVFPIDTEVNDIEAVHKIVMQELTRRFPWILKDVIQSHDS